MYRRNPRADAERVSQVLAGLAYPAAKWQLLMQAEEYGADAASRADLWSLPTGEYAGLEAVLAALRGETTDEALPAQRTAHRLPCHPAQRSRALLHRPVQYRPQPAAQAAARMHPLR